MFAMRAGHEGIQAFQPMHQAKFQQLFQRPVDLQRRPKPMISQLVENGIGAQRPSDRVSTSSTKVWFLVRLTVLIGVLLK